MPTGRASTLLPSLRRVVLARETADRPDADLVAAFARDRDADAFAELVRRHGPMVLGVCRRVTGEWATADDAFQATFLVLARRAAAVRPRSAVGGWLYGVAYRTASKTRAVLSRRRSREKQVDTMPEPPASAPPEDLWSDVRPVIDEELARLPERLRLPVVLCDLEGRPQRLVARHLNLPPATLATRLSSARRLLAGRLTRRGVVLSGGALATVLTGHASAAAVSPRLAGGLARAAEAISAGAPVGSLVSAQAVQLSEGVMRMMLVAKLRAVGAAALATLALTTGLGFGLVPARAFGGDGEKGRQGEGENPLAGSVSPSPRLPVSPSDLDDATFIRRVCLDLRGTPPTPVESGYFAADRDANKRRKVVDWLLTDDAVKAFFSKKLGIPADQIHAIAFVDAGTVDQPYEIGFPTDRTATGAVFSFYLGFDTPPAASATPNTDSGLSGTLLLNEVYSTPTDRPNTIRTNGVWTRTLAFGFAMANTPQAHYRKFITTQLNPPAQPNPLIVDPTGSNTWTIGLWLNDGQNPPVLGTRWQRAQNTLLYTATADTDVQFLRRAIQSARGTTPSAVEEKYFTEDKDPKKREKLLDLLLKDPAVAKKLGDDWKKKMLQPQTTAFEWWVQPQPQPWRYQLLPHINSVGSDGSLRLWQPYNTTRKPSRLEKLVDELLGAKKSDEQVLDGVSLVVLGRLPTESEKKLTLATVGKASNKKAAWVEVAKALSATEEAKAHAAELNKANPPAPKKEPEKK